MSIERCLKGSCSDGSILYLGYITVNILVVISYYMVLREATTVAIGQRVYRLFGHYFFQPHVSL